MMSMNQLLTIFSSISGNQSNSTPASKTLDRLELTEKSQCTKSIGSAGSGTNVSLTTDCRKKTNLVKQRSNSKLLFIQFWTNGLTG